MVTLAGTINLSDKCHPALSGDGMGSRCDSVAISARCRFIASVLPAGLRQLPFPASGRWLRRYRSMWRIDPAERSGGCRAWFICGYLFFGPMHASSANQILFQKIAKRGSCRWMNSSVSPVEQKIVRVFFHNFVLDHFTCCCPGNDCTELHVFCFHAKVKYGM
jgi:hypothetical protein